MASLLEKRLALVRIPMKVRLQSSPPPEHSGIRPFKTKDLPALAELMFEAYQGTIDFEPGSSVQDALEQLEKTVQGEYGNFIPEASFVLEEDGVPLSASLITFWAPFNCPLLAFTMTRPECKGQGLAALVMKSSMSALYHDGYNRLGLVVTDGNSPAQRLYERLGFKPFDPEP